MFGTIATLLIGAFVWGVTFGEICVYDEEHKVGVMFDLLGNPTQTTIGCMCPATRKFKCDDNQEDEFEKLQMYAPNEIDGVTECCVSGPSKVANSGSDVEKAVESVKSKTSQHSKRYKLHCTKESLPGRWEDDLIRGFKLFDTQQNQEWVCTCHHFRFDDFWLCHDESCGPDCQRETYENFKPITDSCCLA